MAAGAIVWAVVRFACWESALFAVAIRLARLAGWQREKGEPAVCVAEFWLAVLAIQVTLESSIAGVLSFARLNSMFAYWIAAAVCIAGSVTIRRRQEWPRLAFGPHHIIGAFVVPLFLLAFKPVEEIDSINYLHYLIEWLANRATPYTFATNYVAFWELSFAPAWMVTRVDLFFPLVALKAVVLMVLALWLVGKELGLSGGLLAWAVFSCVAMQHYWYGPSGVPTLKNDVLHGVGFVLMTLAILRAAKSPLTRTDIALLALGVAFGSVKYTGLFAGVAAIVVLLFLRVRVKPWQWAAVALFFLLTSGHYYLHNFVRYRSPFYPFQLNFAFLHLPGTADLSNTSILYSLHDPRLWRALFLPAGGVSPAGLLFPLILAAALVVSAVRCVRAAIHWLRFRRRPIPLDWAALLLLCGWFLYFRSVFSASAYAGDLAFILNGLNSLRYVDGVLAVSELFLLAHAARFTWLAVPLLAIHLASRLLLLYGKMELFAPAVVLAVAIAVVLALFALTRGAIPGAVLILIALAPLLVERNRERWTTYWNDLKPAIRTVAGQDLAELALPDGGYFAGHVVAAGNPFNPAVRSMLPEEIDALASGARPHYLLVLVSPGSEVASHWETRYGPSIGQWGYREIAPGELGGLYEKNR